MADMEEAEIPETARRVTRPSFAQVKAILEFMEKHPDLAQRKHKDGMSNERFKTLWMELSNIVNGLQGTTKSVKGWIKFWSDKRRSIILKQKQIAEGRITDPLTVLELRILDLIPNIKNTKRKSSVKQEGCNGDDALESIFQKDEDVAFPSSDSRLLSTDTDERYTNVMEKLVDVMDQQALALSQMAEATLKSSKALEQMAEASHKQAMAVDRLAGTFETINASVFDVRNAIMSIDFTMKRCYSTSTQQRENSNLFT